MKIPARRASIAICGVLALTVLYADPAETRRAAAWLEVQGINDVSAVHEIRVEQLDAHWPTRFPLVDYGRSMARSTRPEVRWRRWSKVTIGAALVTKALARNGWWTQPVRVHQGYLIHSSRGGVNASSSSHSAVGIAWFSSAAVWATRAGVEMPTTVEWTRGSLVENCRAAAASGTPYRSQAACIVFAMPAIDVSPNP